MLCLAVHGARASADDLQVLPCRPTITCTADLAAPGTLELELGYQLTLPRASPNAQTTPFLAKLPVLHWLELQAATNGFTATGSARYVDNAVVAAKFHIRDQSTTSPSLAITASISLPTVAEMGYVHVYDAELVVHASKDVGKLHVDVNAGVIADDLGGKRISQTFVAAAATYPLTATVAVALEPHYFGTAAPFAERDAGLIGAIEVAVRSWLVFDAAIDAVRWDQRSIAVIAGTSIAPARLWSNSR
jgi:hypothetical protein